MPLVVETGSGLASPATNSYVTVAEADAYHSDMGNSAWAAATNALKESALIRACRALDRKYSKRFKGSPTNFGVQSLEWPRAGVWLTASQDTVWMEGAVEDNTIPVALKHAQIEAALRELAVPGSMLPDLERGGDVKSVKAGSVEVTYTDGASVTTAFQTIRGVLVHLLKPVTCDVEMG